MRVRERYPIFLNITFTWWLTRKESDFKMSVNDKYVYNIEIDTMQDAKEIVSIATKLNGKIVLKSGAKFSVNAKSLLGVLLAKKLDWNDMKIVTDNDYYHEFEKFIVS
ncbi:MAG: HPr family phosphocarrier protein [Ruminococcaceae bacterium]|nr:HPr family phosphocarrier protein [Oscillospiraceae bacterium]